MTRWINIGIITISILLQSCQELKNNGEWVLPSPDSKIHLYFNLNNGEPYYLVYYEDKIIIDWSLIGLTLQNQVNLTQGLSVCNTESGSKTSNNEIPLMGGFELGENYNELKVCLEKTIPSPEHLIIEFRAYNKGIAFRLILQDDNIDASATIPSEQTQFDLYGKGTNWTFVKDTSNYNSDPRADDKQDADLNLPVSFSSSDGMMVTLTEPDPPGDSETMLIKRDSGSQFFSIMQDEPINSASPIGNNRSGIPWRVIIINHIHEKSSNWN
jgi:alpha-glucosidase